MFRSMHAHSPLPYNVPQTEVPIKDNVCCHSRRLYDCSWVADAFKVRKDCIVSIVVTATRTHVVTHILFKELLVKMKLSYEQYCLQSQQLDHMTDTVAVFQQLINYPDAHNK